MQKQIFSLTFMACSLFSIAFGAGSNSKSSVSCTGQVKVQYEDYGRRGMPVVVDQTKTFTVTVEKDQSYATTNGASQYDLSSVVLNIEHADSESGAAAGENQFYKCIYRSGGGTETHECAEEDANRYAPYTALKVRITGSTGDVETQSYGRVSLYNCR